MTEGYEKLIKQWGQVPYQTQYEKVFFLIGAQNCGKSSFLRFLEGCSFNVQYNDEKQMHELIFQAAENVEILTNETVVPITRIETIEGDHFFADLPSIFNGEEQTPSSLIIKYFAFHSLLKRTKQASFLIFLPYQNYLDPNLNLHLFRIWERLINKSPDIKKLICNSSSLVLTKIESEDDQEEFIASLRNITEANQQLNSFENAIQNSRIRLFFARDSEQQDSHQILEQIVNNSEFVASSFLNLKQGFQGEFSREQFSQQFQKLYQQLMKKSIDIIIALLRNMVYLFLLRNDEEKADILQQHWKTVSESFPTSEQCMAMKSLQVFDDNHITIVIKLANKKVEERSISFVEIFENQKTGVQYYDNLIRVLQGIQNFVEFCSQLENVENKKQCNDIFTKNMNESFSQVLNQRWFMDQNEQIIQSVKDNQQLMQIIMKFEDNQSEESEKNPYINPSLKDQKYIIVNPPSFKGELEKFIQKVKKFTINVQEQMKKKYLESFLQFFLKLGQLQFCFMIMIELKKTTDLLELLKIHSFFYPCDLPQRGQFIIYYLIPYLIFMKDADSQQQERMIHRCYDYITTMHIEQNKEYEDVYTKNEEKTLCTRTAKYTGRLFSQELKQNREFQESLLDKVERKIEIRALTHPKTFQILRNEIKHL